MIDLRVLLTGSPVEKFRRAHAIMNSSMIDAMARVTLDAHRQLKGDYLRRGGSFRPTKAQGYKWVKNPGPWLRVGNGVLVSSWRYVRPTIEAGGRVIGHLMSSCVYARIHEYGGLTGRNHTTRIPKRSYAEPMMQDNRAKWRDWFGHDLVARIRNA